jgi:hypothetical protein
MSVLRGVWACLLLVLAISGCGSAPAKSTGPTSPTPAQVLGDGAGHTFYEITEPRRTPRGTVILIHGGGWTDREPLDGQYANAGGVRFMAFQGWRVVNIGYRPPASLVNRRAAPNAFPALDDVAAFYDQARRAFPGPVCAYGSSSGGHLAMMLAVVRPDLTCVISEAGPIDFTIVRRRYPGYLERIFGASTSALNFWDPTSRWRAAAPTAQVWLGEAANDPIVPREASAFQQVDPAATVTVLPGAAGSDGAPFVHSLVDPGAHQIYLAGLAAWLSQFGTGAAARAGRDPGPRGVIRACNDAVPSGIEWANASSTQRWRLLEDDAGWTAVADPNEEVTATRGCDGRGQDQWAGLALQALALTPSAPTIPLGQQAEHDFVAPPGRVIASVSASFRGWFRDLAEWRVGLYASSSAHGPIATPVATCELGQCHGLRTWRSGTGTAIAPTATGGDPDAVDRLPAQVFALPRGTTRLAWRLVCARANGCNGGSINPKGNPSSSHPTRRRDPVGHPAALTVTGASVQLGG